MRISFVFKLIVGFMLVNITFASDWPQYLGPKRNAVSDEKGFNRSWPEEGPRVLWSFPLGEGFGGPAISEGKVYIYDRVEDKKNILRCIDIFNGQEEWTFIFDVAGSVHYNGSRSVPTIDGTRIYICGAFGNLHCIDKNTHEVIWYKNIWTDFGGTDLPRWAIAQHPLIFKNSVILASQTDKVGIVAYEKMTGEILWTTEALPGKAGYVAPKLADISGKDHLVMISANGAVMGFDPQNGKILWSYDGWQCKIPVPNVTEAGEDRLFITGGYEAGSALIKIKHNKNEYLAEEVFKIDEFGTHVHPPVLYKDHLYGLCSTNEVKDGMVCMDLNGNVKWKTENSPLFDKGGFIFVDDMLISMDGTNGYLYLIDPTPEGFRPLAKVKLLDTKMCWSPLAISNGKLLIRDQKQMKCIEL